MALSALGVLGCQAKVPSLAISLSSGGWGDRHGGPRFPALGSSQSGGSKPDKLGTRLVALHTPGVSGCPVKVPSLEQVQLCVATGEPWETGLR